MPLIDLKTNLKSLKYGNDRPGGGSSDEPYIKTDINNVDRGFNRFRATKFDDGLVRGGIVGAANAAITDTFRIGKFLTDIPKGPLWIVKQVGLQLSNPKLENRASTTGIGFIDRIATTLNKYLIGPTRIYNLGINTIAQVPVNAFGIHFNRHGLLPVQDDNTKYISVVDANNKSGNNRLVGYVNKLLNKPFTPQKPKSGLLQSLLSIIPGGSNFITPQQQTIDSYIGGPNSVYGIGKTFIRRYDYTTNGSNKQQPQLISKVGGNPGHVQYLDTLGVSAEYFSIKDIKSKNSISNNGFTVPNNSAITYTSNNAVGKYIELQTKINNQTVGSIFKYNENKNTALGTSGSDNYNGNINSYITTNSEIVYKNGLKDKNGKEITVKITGSWSKNNRENRLGSGRTDSINLTPIFSINTGTIGDTPPIHIPNADVQTINDLVKFRIQAIDGKDPNKSDWMIFRAYLTQLSDSVDATWNSVKYAGRGEDFYIYGGFGRKIQIGFKVAALSAIEMEPMYQKLNYLMSNLMPDYNNTLMRGPLVKMTVGNWIDGQTGILNSLSYSIPQDSPWEIALTSDNNLILPHVVEVSMTFTPIGSQTKGVNKIASKSQTTSNIAQNINDYQYIK